MNKLMSSAARAVLAQYADAKEVYVTEDGQAFLNANYATNHAAQSGMPEPVRVERDRSDVVMSAEDNAKLEGERIAKEKAAQANVIRRREETAATRSLLNTAKVMEDSPIALRLKELKTLEKVTEKIDKISVFGGLDGVLKDLVKIR